VYGIVEAVNFCYAVGVNARYASWDATMASNQIESLIDRKAWKSAQSAIKKELDHEPDDHWLWSRLSGVKYEQRDYSGALDAAKKALEIVPDCPLALWSYASALDGLGKTKEAGKIYIQLLRRGVEELNRPDDDADECWEGAEWTRRLVMDCIFCLAATLPKIGMPERAATWYRRFLDLLHLGMPPGTFSREDARARLEKLAGTKNGSATYSMESEITEVEALM